MMSQSAWDWNRELFLIANSDSIQFFLTDLTRRVQCSFVQVTGNLRSCLIYFSHYDSKSFGKSFLTAYKLLFELNRGFRASKA